MRDGRRLNDAFRECDGCGTPTGLLEHKPPRLCEGCQVQALWAISGDQILHVPSGTRGTCVADDPYLEIQVLVAGEIQIWPLQETKRIPC